MITVLVAIMLQGACQGFTALRAIPVQAVGPSAVPNPPRLLQGGVAGRRGRGTTGSLQALRGTDALKAQAKTLHMMDKNHSRPLAIDLTGLPQFDCGDDAWGSGIACRRRRLAASIMALLLGSVITEPLAGNAASSPARPRNDDEDYGIDDEEASSLVSHY